MLILFFYNHLSYREREELLLLLRLVELLLPAALLRVALNALEVLFELLALRETLLLEPVLVLTFLFALFALRVTLLLLRFASEELRFALLRETLLLLLLLLRDVVLPVVLALRVTLLLPLLALVRVTLLLSLLVLLLSPALREELLLFSLLRTAFAALSLRVETSDEVLRCDSPVRVGISEVTAVRRFSSELTFTLRLLASREGTFTKPSLRSRRLFS